MKRFPFILRILPPILLLVVLTTVFSPVSYAIFLDVGQGEAMLITGEDGKTLLVTDNISDRYLLEFLESRHCSEIDTVIVTDPEKADPTKLMEQLVIGTLYLPTGCGAVKEGGRDYANFESGSHIPFGKGYAEVLYQVDNTAVIAVNTNGHRLLLMGNADTIVQKKLCEERPEDLVCDFLAVGGKGDRTSCSELLIETAQPEEGAVISCEAKPTVELFSTIRRETACLSTYQNGSIMLEIRKNRLLVSKTRN